jgi:hypothetical protein
LLALPVQSHLLLQDFQLLARHCLPKSLQASHGVSSWILKPYQLATIRYPRMISSILALFIIVNCGVSNHPQSCRKALCPLLGWAFFSLSLSVLFLLVSILTTVS